MVLVSACQGVQLAVSPVAVQVRAVAIHGLQIILGAGVAIHGSVKLQGFQIGVQSGLLLLGQGEALSLGGIGQCIDGVGVALGGFQEVVSPGSAGFLVHHLLVQGCAGVQAEHGGVAAVHAVEVIDGINIEIVHFHAVDLVIAHGQGNRILLADAAAGNGLADADGDGNHQQYHHNGDEANGVKAYVLGFLLGGELLLGQLGGFLLLAKLLLAGCTHVIKSSH